MRLIYIDEAGTSPAEPVRVVASVIVDGDRQYFSLISEIEKILDFCVPKTFRDNFMIHAKDIFNGAKYRKHWHFDDRLDFLKEIACLPFCFDVPLSVGVVFSGSTPVPASLDGKVAQHTFDHLMAFGDCVERADHFLRSYLRGSEVGIVVAEDVPHVRRLLPASVAAIKANPRRLSPDDSRTNRWETILNIPPPERVIEINRIVDVPHFAEKASAPLLQLADVCAFSFRRCLSKQPHGDDLMLAMLGPFFGPHFIQDEVWFSESSSGLFNAQSYF